MESVFILLTFLAVGTVIIFIMEKLDLFYEESERQRSKSDLTFGRGPGFGSAAQESGTAAASGEPGRIYKE